MTISPGKAWRIAKWSGLMFIIAFVVAIVTPNFAPIDGNMRLSRALMDVDMFQKALERYRSDHGDFPTTIDGLTSLVTPPKPYIEHIPIDPWGHQYVYRRQNDAAYQLYSSGINGIDEVGRGDDVVVGSRIKDYRCDTYNVNCLSDKIIWGVLVSAAFLGVLGLLGFFGYGLVGLYGRLRGDRL